MALRLILLAIIAVSVANAAVFTVAGPEEMSFHVVRELNNILSKHFDTLYTYMMMKVNFAKDLARDDTAKTGLDKAILHKADMTMQIIDYAGNRGINPDIDDPQQYDLTKCDAVYGCWKVGLEMERDLYKALSDGYSAAGDHDDADAQFSLVPLVQGSLRSIRYHKAVIAKIAATQKPVKPDDDDDDDDDILFDDIVLI